MSTIIEIPENLERWGSGRRESWSKMKISQGCAAVS